MKQKLFTRPLSVTLSVDMFDQIKAITDQEGIALSDYVRAAIQEQLSKTNFKQEIREDLNMSKEIIIDETLTQQLMTDDKAINGFLLELQNYLKTKLEPCQNEKGVVHYWTCGMDHFYLPPNHDPLKHFKKYCAKMKLNWEVMIKRIEQYADLPICCECFLVNRIELKEL